MNIDHLTEVRFVVDDNNPWPGPPAFTEDQAAFFRGRDDEAERLLDLVKDAPLTLLYGKSGIGKSSLLQAGLFPLLRREGFLPVYIKRFDHDESALDYSRQILRALEAECERNDIAFSPTREAESLWEYFDPVHARFVSPRGRSLVPVLVFDQFEELVRLGRDTESQRQRYDRFVNELADLVENHPPIQRVLQDRKRRLQELGQGISESGGPQSFSRERRLCRVMVTIRSDFLDVFETNFASRIPSLGRNRFALQRMTGQQAHDAVLEVGRHLIEEGVAERIIRSVTARGGLDGEQDRDAKLPLTDLEVEPAILSIFCRELNETRKIKALPQITAALVTESGEEILENFYNRAFEGLPADRQIPARRFVEDDLVLTGGFRDNIDLSRALDQAGMDRETLGHLIESRLLRIEDMGDGRPPRIELTHDVLARVAYKHQLKWKEEEQQRKKTEEAERRVREAEEQTRLAREEAARKEREAKDEAVRLRRKNVTRMSLLMAVILVVAGFALGLGVLWGQSRTNLGRSYFRQARYSLEKNEDLHALAQLSRSLFFDRNSQGAACRLATLLSYRNYLFPLSCLGHSHGGVVTAHFSPDGTRIVTASWDGTACVWDAKTGKPLLTDQTGEPLTMKHRDRVNAAQFSPNGKWIVTASEDKTARVWDAQTELPLTEPMTHEYRVNAAEFSPDGQWIVTASSDGNARVWDWNAQADKPLTKMNHDDQVNAGTVNAAEFSPDYKYRVNTARFSPDGQWIVTASWDGTARVWDAKTGKPLTESMKHAKKVNSAQFSADGKRIVTASTDLTARVWDAQTGLPLTDPMKHSETVWSAEFSRDGKWIVTASWDTTARVWDAQTGKQLIIEPMKHDDRVYAAEFSPDGTRIVTASEDKIAEVWKMQAGKALPELMRHDRPVNSVQFSPDGKRIVTASGYQLRPPATRPLPGHAQVWNADTGTPVGEPMKHESAVTSAQFSPDGKRIVTASGTMAQVWDANTGKRLRKPMEHDRPVSSAQFSHDGRRIVTASGYRSATDRPPGYAQVWDADTDKPVGEPMKHDSAVTSAQFSPDGKRIVTASGTMAQVWDAQTGKHLNAQTEWWRRFFQPPKPLTMEHPTFGYVNTAQFSPDGKQIVTASNDKTARVWDAQTGKQLTEPMKHDDFVYSAQFSSDGSIIVTASEDGTTRVWDAKTGKALTDPMKHSDTLSSVQSDGRRVVMSWDKDTRAWNEQTGEQLTTPIEHNIPGSVNSAQFSPDGKRIVTASNDGTARVWDIVPAGKTAPQWLTQLADAMAGQHFNDHEFFEPLTKDSVEIDSADMLKDIKGQLDRGSTDDDWVIWLRWFLADPSTRMISPFSKITIPEYIEDRIKENTAESLDEAKEAAIGNAEVLERIRKARDEYIEEQIKKNTAESLNDAKEAAIGNPEALERIRKARENLPQTDNTRRP